MVQGALLLGGDSVSGSDYYPHKDIMAGHSSHTASLLFSVIGRKVSQLLGMMNTGLSHSLVSTQAPDTCLRVPCSFLHPTPGTPRPLAQSWALLTTQTSEEDRLDLSVFRRG